MQLLILFFKSCIYNLNSSSYFRGWTNDSGQPLVVFGSYDDGTYLMAVGNNLY